MDFPDLAHTCAPEIHLATLSALVRHESDFNPLAIGVNSSPHRALLPKSHQGAAEAARALMRAGIDFDAGYGQINVRNWGALGLTPDSVFKPCINLAAIQRLLIDCDRRATQRHGATPSALHATLSCYNTGNLQDGMRNGYVARLLAKAQSPLSAILKAPPLAEPKGNALVRTSTSAGRRPDALSAAAPDAFAARRPDAFGHAAVTDAPPQTEPVGIRHRRRPGSPPARLPTAHQTPQAHPGRAQRNSHDPLIPLLGRPSHGGVCPLAMAWLLLMPEPAFAEFQKATAGAKQVQRWLWIVIPVVALIAAAVIGLLYSNDIVRKETLYQWAGGIAFVGAIAGGIIDLFF